MWRGRPTREARHLTDDVGSSEKHHGRGTGCKSRRSENGGSLRGERSSASRPRRDSGSMLRGLRPTVRMTNSGIPEEASGTIFYVVE